MTPDFSLIKKIDAILSEKPKGASNVQITVPTNYRELLAELIASEVDAANKGDKAVSWAPEPAPTATEKKTKAKEEVKK